MKNLFIMLAFVFATSSSFATNNSNLVLNNANHNFLIEQPVSQNETAIEDNNIAVSIVVDKSTAEEGQCTIEGKLTVTTESGDSVSITFTVTADTCKEAVAVQNQMLAAFQ